MRVFFFVLLLLTLGVLLVAGCTAFPGSSLTGGSVPIGDIDGWLYTAPSRANPEIVPDALIELVTKQGQILQTTYTDDAGYFAFTEVTVNNAFVRSGQPDGLFAQMEIERDKHEGARMVLVLAPAMPDLVELRLTPRTVQTTVGDETPFTVVGLTNTGETRQDIPASWVVRGRIGNITDAGVFSAMRAGSGLVVAQLRNLRAMASVTVKTAGGAP